MKNISIFLLLLFSQLQGQISLVGTEIALPPSQRAVLDSIISKYTVFQLNISPLLDSLKLNPKRTLSFRINDFQRKFYIVPNLSMFSSCRFATHNKEEIIYHTDYQPPIYKGKTTTSESARFLIDKTGLDGGFFAATKFYRIEPIHNHIPGANSDTYIIYDQSDSRSKEEFECGVNNEEMPIESKEDDGDPEINTCRYLEFAIDADYDFYTIFGNYNDVWNRIFRDMNFAEVVYLNTFNIQFKVNYAHCWEFSTNNPYTTLNPGLLLTQVNTYALNNLTNVSRDIFHLFTGKLTNPVWAGLSAGGIGLTNGYCWSSIHGYGYKTVAHEIGHNLGASLGPTHFTPANDIACLCGPSNPALGSVMCPGPKADNLWFCSQSISEINTFISNNASSLLGPNHPLQLNLSGVATGPSLNYATQWIKSTQSVIFDPVMYYFGTYVELNAPFEAVAAAPLFNHGGTPLLYFEILQGNYCEE